LVANCCVYRLNDFLNSSLEALERFLSYPVKKYKLDRVDTHYSKFICLAVEQYQTTGLLAQANMMLFCGMILVNLLGLKQHSFM